MKRVLLLAAFFASNSLAFAQKEYKLQYTFKKGEAFEWNQTVTVKQHLAGPGFDQNNESSVIANALVSVIEVTATGAKFEIEYTKLLTKIGQANLTLDSEGDTTKNLQNKVMRALKGKKFQFNLLKNGTVESIENTDNLWSGLTPANGFKE